MPNRILYSKYEKKIFSPENAAKLIKNNSVVGVSGFTKAGDSKSVLPSFAERAETENLKITLLSGASLGYDTDGKLAKSNALSKRMPFQVDSALRNSINNGKVLFIDQHLSETAEMLSNQHLPKVDLAIIEATYIDENGNIIPTTSVGNSASFVEQADHVIIEINKSIPLSFKGIHDIHMHKSYPKRGIIPITEPDTRIGEQFIKVDPDKVIAVVFTNQPDSPARISPPDDHTKAIAKHLLGFFENEVKEGRLTNSLLPLQAGIGKIANAVLSGFIESPFEDLTMYSEVLQDSTFELFDAGKLKFASASSITVSEECRKHFLENFEKYKDKIVLRPQNISNAAEVIRRLGIIAINTAIEFDIYGNVNSTHITGTKMMNGIGGSGDFARNAYLSVFVCPSTSKNNSISHVVPMVSHTDHTEHDVDILVTEQGLADLRGLAPVERAIQVIENCVHPEYQEQMRQYYGEALTQGGHTPHILEKTFNWHLNFKKYGTMKIGKPEFA
ncbi:succinate CoA transferase [Chondrinema litorale]|uniref:succinate CoA transferase n=1 Tax=Chondrinema litorale TaxID=2994555 RepID=UPI002543C95B|nr:succinate CoA transferase [Chondrinema litorale]UZR95403.1 succinate CoA transferase [Chondrinema litorale]